MNGNILKSHSNIFTKIAFDQVILVQLVLLDIINVKS